MNESQMRETFARNLKKAIRISGLSQNAFARKIDVSAQQVSRWVTGKNPPGWEAVAAICNCLNIEATDLFLEEKEVPKRGRKKRAPNNLLKESEIDLFKRFQHFQKAFAKIS